MSKPKHHIRKEVCSTRAPYRDGRKPTAVKVYTIHHESKYLLIQDVPAVGATEELKKLVETLGEIDDHKILEDYPDNQFTEVHLFKYKKIQSARFAKRKLDDWSFYGGVLHVCYAPEFETVEETREKLQGRRRIIETKSRQYNTDSTYRGSFSQPTSKQDDSRENDQHQLSKVRNWPQENFDTRLSQSETTVIQTSHNDYSQLLVESQSEFAQHHTEIGHVPAVQLLAGHCVGNAEQYDRNIQQKQAYNFAEQVLLQAHCSRNYGEHPVSKEIQARRLVTDHRKDEDPDTSVQAETTYSEEQLSLPTPPKQTRFSHQILSSKKTQTCGRVKVQSAQATFPLGFDARLDQHIAAGIKIWKPGNLENDLGQTETIKKTAVEQEEVNSKTMQEKVEENLKNQSIVIKHFNKRTVPKFMPRQTQIKMKLNNSGKGSISSEMESKRDNVTLQIRKNAFKLGNIQGPADLGPDISSDDRPDSKERSVIDSMLQIKQKLTKV